MKTSRFWIAVAVGGVVANIFDYVVHGMILENAYYSKMTELMNQMANPTWYVVGDFVAVFVLAWVFDKVGGSFWRRCEGRSHLRIVCGRSGKFPHGNIPPFDVQRIPVFVIMALDGPRNYLVCDRRSNFGRAV
jgi:hypothetical protein